MSQPAALSAIAFQLVAALERYEQDLEQLRVNQQHLELYQRVSRHMDEMRMYSASLPQVSVPWVEVLIGHFELTHCLWRLQGGGDKRATLERLSEKHRGVVARLRDKALTLVTTS